jgi:hypothetical protein
LQRRRRGHLFCLQTGRYTLTNPVQEMRPTTTPSTRPYGTGAQVCDGNNILGSSPRWSFFITLCVDNSLISQQHLIFYLLPRRSFISRSATVCLVSMTIIPLILRLIELKCYLTGVKLHPSFDC